MITLESIVESLKLQLKPHLNDDVKLFDEFIIRMVDDTRAALIRSLYISHDNLTSFYQQFVVTGNKIYSGKLENRKYEYTRLILPTRLLSGCGRKNIQNIILSTGEFFGLDLHYCSYQEFMSYGDHVYGKNSFVVTDIGNYLLVKERVVDSSAGQLLVRAIVETPSLVPGFQYESTEYPIGANNLRQLEIVTFQHLAAKLGMPVDVINNGYDETKNANIPQPKREREQEQEEGE